MNLHSKLVPVLYKKYEKGFYCIAKIAIEGDRGSVIHVINQLSDSPAAQILEARFWLVVSQQADQFYDTSKTPGLTVIPWLFH